MNKIFNSFISVFISLTISLLVIMICSGRPFISATDFFTGVFSSSFYIGSFLNTASFLMCAGLGASFAILSGNLNLGGEGQIYLAGFLSAIILSWESPLPKFLQFFFALFIAILSGGISAAIPALLRRFKNSSEILTSFLVSAITIPLVDSAIAGNFRDSARNLLATKYINPIFRLDSIIPPSPFNISFFIILLICIFSGFFLYKTSYGQKFCISGSSPLFATYVGMDTKKNNFWGMCFSGMLHGLCGFFAIIGTYFTCHSGFQGGLGWNALSCALIAKANPFAVIPSALLLSWIFTATDRTSMINGFSFDMSGLIQGAILLFVSAQIFFKKRKK